MVENVLLLFAGVSQGYPVPDAAVDRSGHEPEKRDFPDRYLSPRNDRRHGEDMPRNASCRHAYLEPRSPERCFPGLRERDLAKRPRPDDPGHVSARFSDSEHREVPTGDHQDRPQLLVEDERLL